MPTSLYKPTSPGRRNATKRDFSAITKKTPTKSLLGVSHKSGGRNNQGRMTVRHIGGGHKQRFRKIDFVRGVTSEGEVKSIEYDPNRSAQIALIEALDGIKTYIIAPKGVLVGHKIASADKLDIVSGNSMRLKNIPTGISIHAIELDPGRGAVMVRSAGMSASIVAHEANIAVVKLPSGELRRFNAMCRATIGEVSNNTHENTIFGKAGRKRWLGIRPTVRGKAMNPNTHPHGGGEGNTSLGLRKGPKTPWGVQALGNVTRDRNKRSSVMIVRKRSKK